MPEQDSTTIAIARALAVYEGRLRKAFQPGQYGELVVRVPIHNGRPGKMRSELKLEYIDDLTTARKSC